MTGAPSTIVCQDVPLHRLRTLSQDEVEVSGLWNGEVPDGEIWAELRLDKVRLLYVVVLHRDSSVLFSKLNTHDLKIRGSQPRSLWTAAPYSIKLESGREVEVQSLRSQPEERFLVYPIVVVEPTLFF